MPDYHTENIRNESFILLQWNTPLAGSALAVQVHLFQQEELPC
jgi:hypothetical protein